MEKIISSKLIPFYDNKSEKLFLGDSFELLKKIKTGSIDMIFADPRSIEFSYGNIKPFNDFLLRRSESIKEVILNIIMTIPFGFLYSMLKKNIKLVKVIITSFLFSLSIELTQLIMTIFLLKHRSFDVTDLITNTIGGIIGYLAYKNISCLNSKKI